MAFKSANITDAELPNYPDELIYGDETEGFIPKVLNDGRLVLRTSIPRGVADVNEATHFQTDLSTLIQTCATSLDAPADDIILLPGNLINQDDESNSIEKAKLLLGRLKPEDIGQILQMMLVNDIDRALEAKDKGEETRPVFSGLSDRFVEQNERPTGVWGLFAVDPGPVDRRHNIETQVAEYLASEAELRIKLAEMYWATQGAEFYEGFVEAAKRYRGEGPIEFVVPSGRDNVGDIRIVDQLHTTKGNGVEIYLLEDMLEFHFEDIHDLDLHVDGNVEIIGDQEATYDYETVTMQMSGDYVRCNQLVDVIDFITNITLNQTEEGYPPPKDLREDYQWDPQPRVIQHLDGTDALPTNARLIVRVADTVRYYGPARGYDMEGDPIDRHFDREYIIRLLGRVDGDGVRYGSVTATNVKNGVIGLGTNIGNVKANDVGVLVADKLVGDVNISYSGLAIEAVDGNALLIECTGYCGNSTGTLKKPGSTSLVTKHKKK